MRFSCSVALLVTFVALPSFAQENGAPPADLAQTVKTPTVTGAPPPPPPPPLDTTNLELSTGGQLATGNSQAVAVTGQAKFAMRRGANVFAAGLLGNYAEALTTTTAMPGTPTPPGTWKESTENLQGKLRYERYFTPAFSGFLQATGTHDAFQAITFRLNIDPGVKLNFVATDTTKLWGEVGYDFQFDDNYTDANGIEQAGAGGPALDPMGLPYVIQQTDTIDSVRAFLGFRHAFNKDVTLSLGLEFLQGFAGSNGGLPAVPPGYTAMTADLVPISLTGSRLNFDALFVAHVINAFSLGVGFSAKYNSAPLAGKDNLDTATTLTLIYSFTSPTPTPPPPPVCVPAPCLPVQPPPAPPTQTQTTTTTTTTTAPTEQPPVTLPTN